MRRVRSMRRVRGTTRLAGAALSPLVALTVIGAAPATAATSPAPEGIRAAAPPPLAAAGDALVPLAPSPLVSGRAVKAGTPYVLPVTGHGGVPASGVAAVVLEVRLSGPSAAGYLVAYPDGAARPGVTSVSYTRGAAATELVVVQPGPSGKVDLAASAGTVTVAVGVVGYDAQPGATAAGEAFVPVTASRLAGVAALKAGATTSVQVTGRGGIPATAPGAVLLQVSATTPAAAGSLTVYPAGKARPPVTSVGYAKGVASTALVAVAPGAGGKVTVAASGGATGVTVDAVGYHPLTGTPGSVFVPVKPTRVANTANGTGVPKAPLAAGHPLAVKVTGTSVVPSSGVTGVLLEVTALNATAAARVTAYPSGARQPGTTSVSVGKGGTSTALVPVVPAATGKIALALSAGRAGIAVDEVGYYLADKTAPAAVTALTVTEATASAVSLGWADPTAKDLAAVVIRRAKGSTPPPSVTSGTAIATLKPGVVSYRDSGLAASTKYAYALFARDSIGNTSTAATLTVTTAAPPASAQGLIAADLAAGTIDYGTSLAYRTLALFGVSSLPGRYAAMPSSGEDPALFAEIDASWAGLSPAEQATIQPYLLQPNDPASAFGAAPPAAPVVANRAVRKADVAPPPPDLHCNATWRSKDWPADTSDNGFRVWVCAASDNEASGVWTPVITALSELWDRMTVAEPDGMGKPVPDTVNNNPANNGNGKVDVFIVYSQLCSGADCPLWQSDGALKLGIARKLPVTCGAPGYPAQSCGNYMIINAGEIGAPDFKGLMAHEFFHVLQAAHNDQALFRQLPAAPSSFESSFFVEASAEWADWFYGGQGKNSPPYASYSELFQANEKSLLHIGGDNHQYASWVWPLFMQLKHDASSVFVSWARAESATSPKGIDAAVDALLSFKDNFRDFSVWNINPAEYFQAADVGLSGDTWQSRISDFPTTPHDCSCSLPLALGTTPVFTSADALAASYDAYTISNPNIRQVSIDIGGLQNKDSANLDLVGRLAGDGSSPHAWRRIAASSTTLTVCRDFPEQDFNRIYVVISNHSAARGANGEPDPSAAVNGSYTITGKNQCDVPTGYTGSMTASVDFDTGPSAAVTATVNYAYLGSYMTFDCANAPDTTHLVYCYQFTSGKVTWTEQPWSDGNCNFTSQGPVTSPMQGPGTTVPSNAFGQIQVIRRYPMTAGLDLANTYELSQGWPEDMKMAISAAPVDPANDKCTQEPGYTETGVPSNLAAEITPSSGLVPHVQHADGWSLAGSADANLPGARYHYSWTLTPTFGS
jgi:hypothetical protein